MIHRVGAFPLQVAAPVGRDEDLRAARRRYDKAVNEFEAFGMDLAENSTVVDPDWEVGGSNYA